MLLPSTWATIMSPVVQILTPSLKLQKLRSNNTLHRNLLTQEAGYQNTILNQIKNSLQPLLGWEYIIQIACGISWINWKHKTFFETIPYNHRLLTACHKSKAQFLVPCEFHLSWLWWLFCPVFARILICGGFVEVTVVKTHNTIHHRNKYTVITDMVVSKFSNKFCFWILDVFIKSNTKPQMYCITFHLHLLY